MKGSGYKIHIVDVNTQEEIQESEKKQHAVRTLAQALQN